MQKLEAWQKALNALLLLLLFHCIPVAIAFIDLFLYTFEIFRRLLR